MSNKKNYSPLRYPGGKACLTNFLTDLTLQNDLGGGIYVEPYAGGAGAALNLLFDDVFREIHINDFDYGIYAVWYSILNHTDEFLKLITDTKITIDEWYRQKNIYVTCKKEDLLSLGFATFFLNRTNRSGIIFKAGPIGGYTQEGKYKIDVRFNKESLSNRILKIATYKSQINITNYDAIEILKNLDQISLNKNDIFVYLDPPYYNKGKYLYLNNYDLDNHIRLANAMKELDEYKWLISYDNVDEIKNLYKSHRMSSFELNYTLQSKKFGSELLIFSPNLSLSENIIVNSRKSKLELF